jgi:hypothetical protein
MVSSIMQQLLLQMRIETLNLKQLRDRFMKVIKVQRGTRKTTRGRC